ncbi:MAG: S9 family peptidase [Firmicutes bacterium]|nr:S9 family peptidase [Bacillota bacterium]
MKYDYPKCRKSELVEEWFGTKLEAPYTWLRDTYSEEVLDFTRRENEFTDAWFKDVAGEGKVEAMIEKLKADHIEELPMAISPWGDYYLATESKEGNYSVIVLDKDFNKTETLFEKDFLPERTPFGAAACPKNQNILAIMSQVDNAPRPDFVIYDYEKKEVLGILPMTFSGAWSKNKEIFYAASTEVEGEKSITTIKAYDASSTEIKNVFVFDGNAIFGEVAVSEDGETVIFEFSQDYSNKYCYAYKEAEGLTYALNEDTPLNVLYIDSFGGRHYYLSFMDTPNGQVVAVDEGKAFAECEVVYTEENAYLEAGYQLNGEVYLKAAENAASYLFNMRSGERIAMPESVASLENSGETKNGKLFSFDAFLSQPEILEFDGKAFKRVLGKEVSHPELTVELLWANSLDDGKAIPYYLVRRQDAEKNGNNKVIMYGYGGYGVSMPPASTETVTETNIARWVEDGGIYVQCLLRGGNEYGSTWHEEGMGLKKKNCYYDFIGIAEKVIADGWTSKGRIAISGCSNGGLLMSALVTMRPDLWGCVIDSVPHTDMIHFADDDRGPMYVTEYGNPKESKEAFEYFLSYSPVHNVREVEYPPTYIQTGECDNNVPPYHGKSFAATLQEKNKSDNPILLRVLEKGSHDRGQGEVFWQTIAEMHVFIDKALE